MEEKSLFLQIQKHLLEDQKPGEFLDQLMKDHQLKEYPFSYLDSLSGTMQSPVYHPEGDAWVHTIMVVNEAALVKHKSSDPVVFMWAALLHDVGKPQTTRKRKGRITSYGHDIEGEKIAKEFLQCFVSDDAFTQQVTALVGYHMHILYVTKNLPYARPEQLKQESNVKDVALLGWCDRMGRTNTDAVEEKKAIDEFIYRMKKM